MSDNMTESYLLSTIFQRFVRLNKRFLEKYLREQGITYEQYHFLYMLSINPSCNQNFLCEYFNAKKSLVSNVLRNLEDNHLITQKIDPNNRRSYIINLTDKGFEVLDNIREKDKEFEVKFFEISVATREDIVQNFEIVYNTMLKEY